MDLTQLQASLQALMDEQQTPASTPQPAQQAEPFDVRDVLLVSPTPAPAVEAVDPDYADLYAPPVQQTELYEPYVEPYVFDDDLLEETEETGDVKVTNVANSIYRAKRTGLQGLLVSVLLAVGGVLTSLQADADIDWKLIGFSFGQAILTALITFLHNDKSASATSSE